METKDATVIPYHKSNRGRAVKDETKQKVPARKAAAGRKAFQGEYCEYHGPSDDGKGCAKFSHLDTTGLGTWKPPFYRFFLVTFAKAIKPAFIVGFAALSIFALFHFVGGALHFGNTVPKSTDGGVSNNVRHTSSNSVPNSVAKSHGPTSIGNSHNAIQKPVKK
jgi:hypothetical protein